MTGNFESFEGFVEALEEVDILLTQAEECIKDTLKYSVFNKSAVIFLLTKLESYMENVVNDFCFRLSELNLPAKKIPLPIRFQASLDILSGNFLDKLKKSQTSNKKKLLPDMQVKEILNKLSAIWVEDGLLDQIQVNNKFSYGTHGEKEIRRLFCRIGIYDIFEKCLIDKRVDVLFGEASYKISFASDINSLTGYRNTIIHSDSTPSLTHDQIKEYKDNVCKFAYQIDNVLYKWLKEIEGAHEKDAKIL